MMNTVSYENFGAESTADDVLQGIDLQGKSVLITGASGGLGAEAARSMAAKGAHVIVAARDTNKANAVAEEISGRHKGASADVVELDLTDLRTVRSCAKKVLARYEKLDILINNAGVMACPLSYTSQGCELQFGTNHIGHFLLTCLLVPALKSAGSARVINLTSESHQHSAVDFDDVNFRERGYDKWLAYSQSKTANILFSVELNRRLCGHGVTSNAVHPGGIMTDLARHMSEEDLAEAIRRASMAGEIKLKSVEAGAATAVWAATSPSLEGKGGLYLEDCGISGPCLEEHRAHGYKPYAMDPEAAKRLWTLSEAIVGEGFCFEQNG